MCHTSNRPALASRSIVSSRFGNTTPRTRALTRTFRDAPIARLRLRLTGRTRPRFHHPSVSIAVLAILQPLGVVAVRTPRTKAITRRANRALAASIVRPRGSGPTRHFTAPHLSPAPHFRPPRRSSHAAAMRAPNAEQPANRFAGCLMFGRHYSGEPNKIVSGQRIGRNLSGFLGRNLNFLSDYFDFLLAKRNRNGNSIFGRKRYFAQKQNQSEDA